MCVAPKQLLGGLFMGGDSTPPAPVVPPQMPKAPQAVTPLKRKPLGGALPAPAGGTLLTGSSGISDAALLLGGTELLGGGKG